MTEPEILIEKYLEGTITSDEMRAFEDLMARDKDFKAEVDFQLEIRSSLRQQDDVEFREKLGELENQAPKTSSKRFWMGIAASLIGLAMLGMWWFLLPAEKEDLFQAFYTTQRNIHEPLTRANGQENLTYEVFLAYEKEDWQEALDLFYSLKENSPEEYIDLYIGNCQLQLGKYNDAIQSFEALFNSTDLDLKHRGTWYLALAELANGNTSRAKELLQQLASESGAFSDQAKELLEKMD
ncbi:tetratricopeptide repeat protein [Algoriphagus litoralis]|uniref:tetratricopeptide repeat protein n=1 Tax=Algoriphagus litoralis TaxID=2202829 RepID=UPI000DB9217A|nr:tetratricopeptide repeat protein [Algoriphagus litoralis]